VIDELKTEFDLTVFFYNPNIHPESEYLKRKAEVIKICLEWNIPMVDMDYDAKEWCDKIGKGRELEQEGGERCLLCFKFRLAKTAEYAAHNGFHYFGTSLTSGRNKKAEIINPIAKEFAKQHKIKFYDADWKKGGRQEKAAKMIAERGIYRQNYCGCAYSKKISLEE
jgi:predicted adenine nucleotide alpha hydrolase (AANH) superfamily ATPase